jgi:hypothetical protein
MTEPPAKAGLSPPRRALIHVAIAIVVVGHLASLIAQREYWPFSYYPMYADLRTDWSYEALRLVGVTSGGLEVAFEHPADIAPFSAYGLNAALRRFVEAPDHEQQVPLVLFAWLDYYNRTAGTALRPRLAGLRLYRVRYQLTPNLRPKAKERAPILTRERLAEVP